MAGESARTIRDLRTHILCCERAMIRVVQRRMIHEKDDYHYERWSEDVIECMRYQNSKLEARRGDNHTILGG